MSVLLALLAAMQALPADAPTVEHARRAIQEPLRLARMHAGGMVMINATTTTTPEAEHIATGARCRFWYGGIEIRPPWLDDRAISCTSAGGWVHTSLTIYDLRGPRRSQQWGIAPLLNGGPVPLDALAERLVAGATVNWAGAGPTAPPQRRELVSPGGRRLEVLHFAIAGPGGAPSGTPGSRHDASRLLVVDGWLFEVSAGGPSHYREAIEGYADSGLRRLVESIEGAGQLPSFRRAQ